MTYKNGHLLEVIYYRGDVEFYVKQSDEKLYCVEFKILNSNWQDHHNIYSYDLIIHSDAVNEIIDHGPACEEIWARLL